MRCFNCGFENIPGLHNCARCQSLLDLGDVAVLPPRASRFRLGSHARRLVNGMILSWRRFWHALPRWLPVPVSGLPQHAATWSILPGLGHIKYANKPAGWLLLSAWLFLLAMSLATLGLPASSWCVTGAVAIHALSILSLAGAQLVYNGLTARLLSGALLFALLRVAVYWPVGWLGERFYVPFPVAGMLPGAVVQDGDVVLYQGPWRRAGTFARGDLVIYRVGGAGYHGHGYVVREGFGLDRVVGVPGDQIQVKDGALLINGHPAGEGEKPLGGLGRLGGLEFRVGEGEYAIVPSQLRMGIHGNVQAGRILAELSRVRDSDLLGRIVLRLHPRSRFGRIR